MTEHPERNDPVAIFARLRDVSIPDDALEDVTRTVMDEITISSPRPHRWVGLAAGILLAVMLGSLPSPPVPFRDGSRDARALEAPVAGDTVELFSEADSSQQMFDFTVGDTQVVMIFDEGLEL